MKTFLGLALVLGLSAVTRTDAGVQFGRENDRARGEQVCVYKDINYFGAEQCYRVGEEINNLGTQNNSISSIRVYGRVTITVYDRTAFGGNTEEFTSDVSDLGKRLMAGNTAWNDRIDSLRVGGISPVNDRTNSRGSRRNQPQQPRDGICVYDRPNYEGRSECWNQGQSISDLAEHGDWSGQISSIRLFGGRTVALMYQDTGYRGESLTVDRDIPDLTEIRGRGRGRGRGNGRGQENGRTFEGWDRQISSLRVQTLRQSR
jgi:hypothetical protein